MISPEQREEWRALADKATSGPWRAEIDSCDCGDGYGCSHGRFTSHIYTPDHQEWKANEKCEDLTQSDDYYRHIRSVEGFSDVDGEFIAASRSAVPALLEENQTQRDEIERLTGCLEKANKQFEHYEREWYLRGDEIEELENMNMDLSARLAGKGDQLTESSMSRHAYKDAWEALWLQESPLGQALMRDVGKQFGLEP